MNTNKAIILLSGGLDSYACLDIASKKMDVKLALTFNYGQKAFEDELIASKKMAKEYNLEHIVIEVPFLKDISNNALTNEDKNDFNSLENVWIPNRNGLFLNIAGCYCDKFGYDYIIIGANKEEAKDFKDNSKKFIKKADEFFKYSTTKRPKVFAPLINMKKVDTVNYLIDNNLNFEYIKSCYNKKEGKKHCNECMSCKLLYNAIKNSKKPELLGELF